MGKTKVLVAGLALAGMALAGCGGGQTAGVPGSTDNGGAVGGTAGAFDSIKALSDAVSEKSSSAQSAKMTMQTSFGGQQITAKGDFKFAGADTAMDMTMEIPGVGEMQMRLVDGLLYMKMPASMSPGDKPWVKIDPNDSGNPMAMDLGSMLETAEKADPRQTISELAKVGAIKDVQPDTIDGQDTTKYTIEVELAKLAKDNKLGIDPAAVKELEKAGMKTLTYDVWVNGENLPVRVVSEMTVMGQDVKVQVDYTDWGTPVEVEAPPADQVGELPGG